MLNDSEIREALAEPVRQIIQAVRNALERTPPELSADICDRGIMLSGGGALLPNMDERIHLETGVPVQSWRIRCRQSSSARERCSRISTCFERCPSTESGIGRSREIHRL